MKVQIVSSNVLLIGVMETANRENREEKFSKEMKQKDFLELKDVSLYLENTHEHLATMNQKQSIPKHVIMKFRAS